MEVRNEEGYVDFTAAKAIERIDALNEKAYYTTKTIKSVARLAGFKIKGEIILVDRDGTVYHTDEILKRMKAGPIFKNTEE